jgi:hypothetical protein
MKSPCFERCSSLVEGKRSPMVSGSPALGQCNVTALLVHDLYGGGILKTPPAAGVQFYNMIDGKRLNLTASQVDDPITDADPSACRDEAASGVAPSEYEALVSRYLRAIKSEERRGRDRSGRR